MFSALCRLEKLSVIAMGNKKKNLSDMFFVNVKLESEAQKYGWIIN